MAFSVSHWSGRLGNNMTASCKLYHTREQAAEKYNTDFNHFFDP